MISLPSSVRIRENSFIARIAAWKLGTRNVAIVIGHTIHLWNCPEEAFLQQESWVKHELCHVRQYEQYGVAGFIIRYLWESLRKGYYNNRFEVEARAAEEG